MVKASVIVTITAKRVSDFDEKFETSDKIKTLEKFYNKFVYWATLKKRKKEIIKYTLDLIQRFKNGMEIEA